MKNIFLSVVVVCALAVAGIGGTLADWQLADVEGNYNWDAGFLTLEIDLDGVWLVPGAGQLPEGNVGYLINADSIAPGDSGETTLSFHVYADPADPGATANLTVSGFVNSFEHDMLAPEALAGDTTDGLGTDAGELQDFLVIKLWFDEGSTPGWDNYYVGEELVIVDSEEGDNIYQHGEELLYWGIFADMVTCIEGGYPMTWEVPICETVYLGVSWELADYGTAYGHSGDEFTPSPNNDVNQCMTDALDGKVTFTLAGPFPAPD